MYETIFFCTLARFSLLAAGRSSRSRPRGTQGARVYSRRKFGPPPGSVARALGVQSRASWQVISGSLSADPEPNRTVENHPKKMNIRFSHVLRLNNSSKSPGDLAPPCVQQQSRLELLSWFYGAFVCVRGF